MTEIFKHKIAESFPSDFDQAILGINISSSEFKILEDGIFAESMDEKWNIFVINDILYLSRSWTHFCIFKVFVKREGQRIILHNFQVNRNQNEYNSNDIEFDIVLLKKVLQIYLKREDFYVDPKLEIPIIKAKIQDFDPDNECKRSIGDNNVGLTRQIFNRLTSEEQKEYFEVIGWDELKSKISDKSNNEPLISLDLQNKRDNSAITFYFDQDAKELLGQIIINNKFSSPNTFNID